jgi:hypothetical protein
MKNSAWYHKLWRKKLNELPLKEDAGSAWMDMKNILDRQMPVNNSLGGNTIKPFGTKLISILGYVLPAAAMIGTVAYIAAPLMMQRKPLQLKKKQPYHIYADTTAERQQKDTVISQKNSADFPDSSTKHAVTKGGEISNSENSQHFSGKSQLQSKTSFSIDSIQNTKTAGGTTYDRWIDDRSSSLRENIIGRSHLLTNVDLKAALRGQDNKSLTRILISRSQIRDKSRRNMTKPVKNSSKTAKNKKPAGTTEMDPPTYNYGLETGIHKTTLYFGAFGSYRLQSRWLINAGIRVIPSSSSSGSYNAQTSYSKPDTLSTFTVKSSRKLLILAIPLSIEYRISNMLNINAGPVIGFSLKQSAINNQYGVFTHQGDTLKHTQAIDSTLRHSTINKANLGISGGISVHIKQFYIDIRYQQDIIPYKISTGLGSYQQYNNALQLGIRYQFRK